MNTDNSSGEMEALVQKVSGLEKRVKKLEELLDNENHDLFEEWFKRFLDDKCNGGW